MKNYKPFWAQLENNTRGTREIKEKSTLHKILEKNGLYVFGPSYSFRILVVYEMIKHKEG
jgi:hypothetical protein